MVIIYNSINNNIIEMIKKVIQDWDKDKDKLDKWFREEADEYINYSDIVEKLFELVIKGYDSSKITEVDDGDYQGTQIYLIPRKVYQPSEYDYLVTNNDYGSCSGCDTLLDVLSSMKGEERIKELMIIALHLVQRMKPLYEDE